MNWLFKLLYPNKFLELERENRDLQRFLAETEADKRCESCESLKMQVADLRCERDKLLDKIISPVQEPSQPQVENLQPLSAYIPWRVRRQQLEARERILAEQRRAESDALKQASNAKPDSSSSVDHAQKESRVVEPREISELERELGIVSG